MADVGGVWKSRSVCVYVCARVTQDWWHKGRGRLEFNGGSGVAVVSSTQLL